MSLPAPPAASWNPPPAAPVSTGFASPSRSARMIAWWRRVFSALGALLRTPLFPKSWEWPVGWGLALVTLIRCSHAAYFVMRGFPNSADEEDYLWVSKRLLEWRLSLPSPAVPLAFEMWWRMDLEGRTICQYPPTWPAMMAPFTALGVPWLANPVYAALTILCTYHLGRLVYGASVGLVTCLLLMMNAMFIYNAGSFFPHIACMLWTSVFMLVLWKSLVAGDPWERRPWRTGAVLGFAAGCIAAMRPQDAVVSLGGPTLVVLLPVLWRWRFSVRAVPAAAVGTLAGLAPLLLHNLWATGSVVKLAYGLFTPDHEAPHVSWEFWKTRFNVITDYRNDFSNWALDPVYLVGVAPLLWFLPRQGRAYAADAALLLTVPLNAAYLLSFTAIALHFNSYGPRYAIMILVPGALLLAQVLVRVPSRVRVTVAALAVLAWFAQAQVDAARKTYGDRITERTSIYRAVEEAGLKDAVVFMDGATGDMDQRDMARNDADMKNPVIFAVDRGASGNLETMLKMFPERKAYLWHYEGSPGRARLTALDPTLGMPSSLRFTAHEAHFSTPITGDVPPRNPPYTLNGDDLAKDNGQRVDGSGWQVYSNGRATAFVNLPVAGRFRFTAWMKGEPALGVDPKVMMEVDDAPVQVVMVEPGAYRPYVLPTLELKPGPHHFSLRFTNDISKNGQDRNLDIQKVRLEVDPQAP